MEKINVTPQFEAGPIVVWKTGPGTDYPDFNNLYRRVSLPHDGLFFQRLGSTQYLYYVDAQQPFHEIWTFDTTIPNSHMIPPSSTPQERCALSEAAAQVIDPGWSIVQMNDLDTEQVKLWKQHTASDCPGIASADFFGDGKEAHGVALFKRGDDKLLTKLVVLRPTDKGYRSFLLAENLGDNRMNVVWPIAPGTYNQYGLSNPTVAIPHTGLAYQYLNESQVLYYVKPEQTFHEVLTFD
jgi:hypothetical protein